MKERLTIGPRKSLPKRAALFLEHLPHKLRVIKTRLNPDIFLPEKKNRGEIKITKK